MDNQALALLKIAELWDGKLTTRLQSNWQNNRQTQRLQWLFQVDLPFQDYWKGYQLFISPNTWSKLSFSSTCSVCSPSFRKHGLVKGNLRLLWKGIVKCNQCTRVDLITYPDSNDNEHFPFRLHWTGSNDVNFAEYLKNKLLKWGKYGIPKKSI